MKIAGMMAVLILLACRSESDEIAIEEEYVIRDSVVCYSLFAKPLKYPVETRASFNKKDSLLSIARKDYEADSRSLDNIIWYGRRLSYLAEYPKAMSVYTRGLHLFPSSPDLYRHRGHRYLSMRRFEEAINDLTMAAELARGRPVEIEPDGIPNHLNKPLSSLQFNIWYHLGLAHYLAGDYESAAMAYDSCMTYSTNDDLLCATTNWYYLTARRLGNADLAGELLGAIDEDMEIIENEAYHDMLLVYKGMKEVDRVLATQNANEHQFATLGYGIAANMMADENPEEAKPMIDSILSTDAWASFGYIAAEADVAMGRIR